MIRRLALTMAVLGTAMTAGQFAAPSSAVAAMASGGRAEVARSVAAAGGCDPVWFIGARGSGESATDGDGMGAPVHDMEAVAASHLQAEGLTVHQLAVGYPAASVDVLIPNKAVLALLAAGHPAEAAALYLTTSVDPYDASMDKGIAKAETDVASALAACPDAKIIMAGYSQGAVAVHDAENWLARNKPAESGHIAGTLLLGDPDRVQYTKDRTFGTALADAEGLRVRLGLVRPHEVPNPLDTAEIANADDAVGDFAFSHVDTIARAKHSVSVHTSYPKTAADLKLLTSAAAWVASKIPGDLAWRSTTAPVPVDAVKSVSGYANVSGVSCPSSSFCAAVGTYDGTPANGYSLLSWAGGSWTAKRAPLPANAAAQSDPISAGVSCPSQSFCVGVGEYADKLGDEDGLLLTWTGTTWGARQAPLPGNAVTGSPAVAVGGVSCPSASFCTAVGSYGAANEQYAGLLLSWSGGRWTAAQAPLPGNAAKGSVVSVDGVACSSASYCVAVGNYQTASGGTDGLLLTRTGTTWAARQAPLPAGAPGNASLLDGVSCQSPSLCIAVGEYSGASGDFAGDLLTWTGNAWTAASAPLPGNAAGAANARSYLSGVSCPSASSCTAVGYYTSTSGRSGVTLLTWAGGRWTAAQAALPGNAPGGVGSDVSCASASFCAATGLYVNASNRDYGLLLTRTG